MPAPATKNLKKERPFRTLERNNNFEHPSTTASPYPKLHKLIEPHIESFNVLFEQDGLLEKAIEDLPYRVAWDGKGTESSRGNKLQLKVESVTLARPMAPERDRSVVERRVFPGDAREKLATYAGQLTAKISYSVNDGPPQSHNVELGQAPVMVKSIRCNLRGFTPAQMVQKNEEPEELGGYFIINGNEKIIRFLIVPRQNYTMGIIRESFSNRGAFYSKFGVQIRAVRPDKSSQTNTLHYLSNGGVTLRFAWRKNEYMVPIVLVLKALLNVSDKDIFLALIQGDFQNTFLTDRIELLLRGSKIYKLHSSNHCRAYLGSKFRVVLNCPEDWTHEQVGTYLLERIVLVHLKKPQDKFNMLISMLRKLYALTAGECAGDNPDSPANQEILLPGFLYGMMLKEKLDELLLNIRAQVNADLQKKSINVDFFDSSYLSKLFQKVNSDIGRRIQAFMATGNLVSPSGLDLQQASGFTIVAEKLNFYRYISHFRCVHRGAFFTELKTTTVRKLLPEAWGFLCPVHTPDGSPCGLLNHLAHECRIITKAPNASHIPALLSNYGLTQGFDLNLSNKNHVVVQLDGRVIGWALPHQATEMARALRVFKTNGKHKIPLELEIGHVPISVGGQYPGLYLFSDTSRMMRPVTFLHNRNTDLVGSFEQVYMDIAVAPDEIIKGKSTHVEISPTHVLSVLANMTPFSDFNQSPRNMYQCQMGKQTMGTPSTTISRRTDNKLYRLHCGQTPIVRPKLHNEYGMDGFPQGTNAIVAVISYTGYDMEDAMILNKSAHERGFGNGAIYKSHIVDLTLGRYKGGHFGIGSDIPPTDSKRKKIESDGFPSIGSLLKSGDYICAFEDPSTGRTKFEKYKGDEDCFIDQIRLIGNTTDQPANKVHIKLRIPRAPVIGDKFSSRHGQKGVCSQKYAAVDMPFSESGMQPDVIINPHAFPSRMTIGMLIESMAGKAGAMHCIEQDSTPFTFSEEDTPADYFGDQLVKAGYNYHGNEPMYSGITGEEFKADIYLGCVYYQRLRHMVSDKWQVRTTGPVDSVTKQPVKGRKRGGGVRFGEMERDALIAHGTSFLLQDRLFNCSDYSTTWICRQCGSLVGIGYEDIGMGTEIKAGEGLRPADVGPMGEYCRICRAKEEEDDANVMMSHPRQNNTFGSKLSVIAIPYVFRYLVAELAAMGISLKIKLD